MPALAKTASSTSAKMTIVASEDEQPHAVCKLSRKLSKLCNIGDCLDGMANRYITHRDVFRVPDSKMDDHLLDNFGDDFSDDGNDPDDDEEKKQVKKKDDFFDEEEEQESGSVVDSTSETSSSDADSNCRNPEQLYTDVTKLLNMLKRVSAEYDQIVDRDELRSVGTIACDRFDFYLSDTILHHLDVLVEQDLDLPKLVPGDRVTKTRTRILELIAVFRATHSECLDLWDELKQSMVAAFIKNGEVDEKSLLFDAISLAAAKKSMKQARKGVIAKTKQRIIKAKTKPKQ